MANDDVHILILSSWYPSIEHPFLGNFVRRHADLLSTKYKVTVVNTQVTSTSAIEVTSEQHGNLQEIRVSHPQAKGLAEKRKLQKNALQAGINKIQKVDLIIGHVALPKGLQFVQAKKHFGCPLILVEHASYYRQAVKKERSWIQKFILRRTRRFADEVVAVSDFLKSDMTGDYPKHQIKVIGNHIDTTTFSFKAKPANNITEFLHVSTLDEKTKNPEGILCACKTLLESTSDFRLTIVSDEDYSQWEMLAEQFGLKDNVQFVGPLSWAEVATYYHQADAFVLFSNYESFSIVLAEAWATGTPVITTPVGIAHKMDESLGTKVAISDKKMLTTALLNFIESKDKYIGERIAEHGNQFSSEQILNKWTKLIETYVG